MIIRVRMGIKESTSKFQEIINQLFAYVNQKQLPKHIKIRLEAYYYHRFRKNYFREKTIMLTLSGNDIFNLRFSIFPPPPGN